MKPRNLLSTFFLLAVGVAVIAAATPAVFAMQQGVAISEEAQSPFPQLATLTGIVAATTLVVEVLKRLLVSVKVLNRIPTWMYAIGTAIVLVLIANRVLGVLQGDMGPLMWSAALLGASASGFWTWLRQPADSPKINLKPAPVLLLSLLMLVGCQADHTFTNAADSYHQTVGESWADYVEADETLTPVEQYSRITAHETFGRAIEAKKEADQSLLP